MLPDLIDIFAARTRLAPYLTPTPLERASGLGAHTWLKLENANKTHSFKVRGALNALRALDPSARARGVVTASSGNHAQGIAYAAQALGIHADILMSVNASPKKMAGVRRWGVKPILFGATYDDAENEALRRARDEGLTYISPYNNALVIAGQGTIAMEIIDVLPDVRRVIVPVGGGGLISGVALAIKTIQPAARVIGVSPAASPDMLNTITGMAHPLSFETLADALPGAIETGSITLDLTRRYVDDLVLVSEDAIAHAMHWMIAHAGWLAEGGGVVGLAALLSGVLPMDADPGATVIVISGGNVDSTVITRVLNNAHGYSSK